MASQKVGPPETLSDEEMRTFAPAKSNGPPDVLSDDEISSLKPVKNLGVLEKLGAQTDDLIRNKMHSPKFADEWKTNMDNYSPQKVGTTLGGQFPGVGPAASLTGKIAGKVAASPLVDAIGLAYPPAAHGIKLVSKLGAIGEKIAAKMAEKRGVPIATTVAEEAPSLSQQVAETIAKKRIDPFKVRKE